MDRVSRYQQFKDFQKRILVATNLFGRGMDIERVRNLLSCLSMKNLLSCLSMRNLLSCLSMRNLLSCLSMRNLLSCLSMRNLLSCLSMLLTLSPQVNIVFNYDMPEDTDTYLHRVARAGRSVNILILIHLLL